MRSNACRGDQKCYKRIHQNMHAMVHTHGLFQAEKRSGTMKVVQEIQNELFEKRRARTHGFRAEMVVRTVGSEWKIHVGNGISV